MIGINVSPAMEKIMYDECIKRVGFKGIRVIHSISLDFAEAFIMAYELKHKQNDECECESLGSECPTCEDEL
jgi:hypothetical protein